MNRDLDVSQGVVRGLFSMSGVCRIDEFLFSGFWDAAVTDAVEVEVDSLEHQAVAGQAAGLAI
jgi:hypothetical protein